MVQIIAIDLLESNLLYPVVSQFLRQSETATVQNRGSQMNFPIFHCIPQLYQVCCFLRVFECFSVLST
jgi:hypothetical protein